MKSKNLVKRYLITPDQAKAIKKKAKELKVSESAVVRGILENCPALSELKIK